MIDIYPDKISSFSNKQRNKIFCLIITDSLRKKVSLKHSKCYVEEMLFVCQANEEIDDVIRQLPANSDILFIPYLYNKLPFPDREKLTPKQRFLIFACIPTTPVTIKDVQYFLNLIYVTDTKKLQKKADKFFKACEYANEIEFVDQDHSTSATLTINDDVMLSEICGNLEPRDVGIVPSGEVAFTHPNFKDVPPFCINGDITLLGLPILHCHTYTSKAFAYQQKLFTKLNSLQKNAVAVILKNGEIAACEAIDSGAKDAVQVLNEFFSLDPRYRVIVEIGIGLNSNLKLLNHNSSMNETYGGDNMCVHFGIGVGPFTTYHLDVICPGTQVKVKKGNVLIKGNHNILQMRNTVICPCDKTINHS